MVAGSVPAGSQEIARPTDAPKPLSPDESRARFRVPPGYRIELLASEPLIREPVGVCWDEQGRLYVAELHGYNLEGQYDIEELNRQGVVDREVRRIQANDDAKRRAEAETYGTIKRLADRDGDGRFDEAVVWADRLPPCHGICPARGGLIAACTTQILYLADEDGDGRAERRDVLFEGFPRAALERAINAPQWGPDNWIYLGRGADGAEVAGPRLDGPRVLPATDFRIRSDGSEIEPILGGTHTVGHALSETGERFVVATQAPAIWVAPFDGRDLRRQPHLALGDVERDVSPTSRAYPISAPHPWRLRRASDPGFAKFYTDHYGVAESAPNGYFTSACSPLIYQDDALPGLRGSLLVCEPAQNLVHRAIVADRPGDDPAPRLAKPEGERDGEFLRSSDPWFHPVALAHAPDGSIVVVDFYREIIEDYSAIPRYLQQEYGLVHGRTFGRLWRLTSEAADRREAARDPALAPLPDDRMVEELASPRFWRRRTAQRLLVERNARGVVGELRRTLAALPPDAPAAHVLALLYTLEGLGELGVPEIACALRHQEDGVRVHGLRLADRRFEAEPELLEAACALSEDASPRVVVQLALSLGESRRPLARATLRRIAQARPDVAWLPEAIVTALGDEVGDFLASSLADGAAPGANLIRVGAATVARRRNARECDQLLRALHGQPDPTLATACLRSWVDVWKSTAPLDLGAEAREALRDWAGSTDPELADLARQTIVRLALETSEERATRLADLREMALDPDRDVAARQRAIETLTREDQPSSLRSLAGIFLTSTPTIQRAIVAGLVQRRQNWGTLADALESGELPAWGLTAIEREQLLRVDGDPDAARIARALEAKAMPDESLLQTYREALTAERDLENGARVFREACANCHAVRGVGHAVGPDLLAEFQRAEETIVQDVLAPSSSITAGYGAYTVATRDGRILTGLIVAEGPANLTIRQSGGGEEVVLRTDIEEIRANSVSLMPDGLDRQLSPKDLADVIGWLRRGE
jgi:putative membrane-bound dehydrogenase-like protein